MGRGTPWAPSPFPRPSPSVQRWGLSALNARSTLRGQDCLSPDEWLKKRRHGEVRCVARSHTAGRKGQRARVPCTHPCASLLACLTPCVPLGPEGRDLPHSSLPLVCDGGRRRGSKRSPGCVSSSPAWPVPPAAPSQPSGHAVAGPPTQEAATKVLSVVRGLSGLLTPAPPAPSPVPPSDPLRAGNSGRAETGS